MVLARLIVCYKPCAVFLGNQQYPCIVSCNKVSTQCQAELASGGFTLLSPQVLDDGVRRHPATVVVQDRQLSSLRQRAVHQLAGVRMLQVASNLIAGEHVQVHSRYVGVGTYLDGAAVLDRPQERIATPHQLGWLVSCNLRLGHSTMITVARALIQRSPAVGTGNPEKAKEVLLQAKLVAEEGFLVSKDLVHEAAGRLVVIGDEVLRQSLKAFKALATAIDCICPCPVILALYLQYERAD